MKEHYFSEKQTSEFKPRKITETIKGKPYEFTTAQGVFSKSRVDYGTKLLAENMQIKQNDRVLDLGCGIGIIGRIAAEMTKNQVTLTDINERACKLAAINTSGQKNAKITQGNMYHPVKEEKFDAILLNPPQTAGKQICFQMIIDAKEHLNANGTLQIVARHNKGGKTLSEKMQETFSNVETIAKSGGYRVYLSRLK